MQTLLVYALKATIYSCILFGYYYISLRNKRFHYYNRFYLLMSVALSLLLPFVNIQLWQYKSSNPQVIQLLQVTQIAGREVVATGGNSSFDTPGFLFIFYCIVALFLLLALLFSVIKILRFKTKYLIERIDNINFINTDLEESPFSFFNNLFWKNTVSITEEAGKQMFTHELTHIKQKHSWDKVFMRMITSVFWFNPAYWLMQKELALIHEFIADETAIENNNAEAFALMILQSAYTKHIFSPAQSFYYSPIKRRLLMLTTSKEPRFSYARRIMILPLLAALVLLFAFKLKQDAKNKSLLHTNAPFVLVIDAGHGGNDLGAISMNDINEKDINLAIAKKIEVLAPQYGITVKMTRTRDETVTLQDRVAFIDQQQPNACISIHVNATDEKQTSKSEVSVYITNDESKDNYQQSRLLGSSLLQAEKNNFSVDSVLQQRKMHRIYFLDKNNYAAVILECGYINNAESVKQLTNDAKVEQLAKDILTGVVAYANADKSKENVMHDTTGKQPLYLVNDKETSAADVKKIDANSIESINVLKDSAVVKKYGEKGKDGVVIIKLKSNSVQKASSTPVTIRLDGPHYDTTIKPLYILDGKEMDNKDITKISPDQIESINVLKDEEAKKKYGEKGKHGVVLISLKKQDKDEKQASDSFQINLKSNIVQFPAEGMTMSADTSFFNGDKNKLPLILVDGKETDKKDFDKIAPNAIQSVNVWQGNDAVKKFNEKGKNGVIEIELKKQ